MTRRQAIGYGLMLGSAAAILACGFLYDWLRVPSPSWDGSRWSCPAGWSVYVSEAEVRGGADGVHCVKP
jgi:hypothetical protein